MDVNGDDFGSTVFTSLCTEGGDGAATVRTGKSQTGSYAVFYSVLNIYHVGIESGLYLFRAGKILDSRLENNAAGTRLF